jgi:electron transfer flavoprotein beta subunit
MVKFAQYSGLYYRKEADLKIVVCVKQVPDSAAKVTVAGGQVTWGDAPLVLNPWDEYAVETALVTKENHGGDVIVISLGGESARDALKTALAMGCGEAVLISDPALAGADSQTVAQVLAAAIKKIGSVDVAFFGKQAIDGDMGVTAAQTARVLGWPALTLVSVIRALDPGAGTVVVERSIEEGRQVVEGKLPVVISVGKDIGEPRYPSFMGIRKASKTPIPIWKLADLGIPAPKSVVHWPEIVDAPVREVVTEMITGGSPKEIAERLAEKILAEKVL